MIFHTIRVLRGAEMRDLLSDAAFDLYRAETERDRLIYNGTLELSYILPDLRVGDVVDYSYSIVGKNPAMGPHFSDAVQQQYGVPMKSWRNRLLFPQGYDIHLKTFSGAMAPEVSVEGAHDVYTWQDRDVPALQVEGSLPPGTLSFPQTQVSSFDSWAAVGRYFAPYFDVSGPKSEAIARVASNIRESHASEAARLRAALGFVQREVRYLGIELGAGGYIPRPAGQVLARRFGDCKDMVVLLTSLLDALDIEAAPLLVNSDLRGAVQKLAPTYEAFDHVIVAAKIGGQTYFLDPTRGEQLGDLEHLQQGRFGKGVVISAQSPGMIEADGPLPPFYKSFKDRYVPLPDWGTMRLISLSEYHMGEADNIANWIKSAGLKGVERSFLEYYQGIYKGLQQTGPLKLEMDEDDATIRLTADYIIPAAWTHDQDEPAIRRFWVEPHGFFDQVPDFDNTTRKSAHVIAHPVRVRHDVEVLLDDSWQDENIEESYDHPAFSFDVKHGFKDGILSRQYTYVTKTNRVEPEDFRASKETLDHVRSVSQTELAENTLGDGSLGSNLRGIFTGKF